MKISEIPLKRMEELNQGRAATTNLTEWLAVDQSRLLQALKLTQLSTALPAVSVPQQIAWIGKQLAGFQEPEILASHPSDLVRCWACYAAVAQTQSLPEALKAVRRFAEDAHFGIREVAWMAVREQICADPKTAIARLLPWARSRNEFSRRFASEATRPRGVWAKHIIALKSDPSPALPLLQELRSDSSKYVRDSVGNWLNDAAKDNPAWVKKLVREWTQHSPTPETAYIVKKATRSFR